LGQDKEQALMKWSLTWWQMCGSNVEPPKIIHLWRARTAVTYRSL